MDIEIKILGRKDVQSHDRKSVTVETHSKRGGDAYSVMKADAVMENDVMIIRVKDGDRLVITTPEGDNEVVYDAAQGAAVRKSSLEPSDNEASRSIGQSHVQPVNPPPTGTVQLTEAQRQAQARLDQHKNAVQKEQERVAKETQPKVQAEADAKNQQQSGAGRPSGENPPKPGSPVGSPPDGNEGKK